MKITTCTAKRTLALIKRHNGDLPAAIYDIRLGLQSLGGYYTDRKSEAVLDLLLWLHVRDQKFPDSIQTRRDAVSAIAATDQGGAIMMATVFDKSNHVAVLKSASRWQSYRLVFTVNGRRMEWVRFAPDTVQLVTSAQRAIAKEWPTAQTYETVETR